MSVRRRRRSGAIPASLLLKALGGGTGLYAQSSTVNLLTAVGAYDNAAWTKVTANVTVNADATAAPSGATTADRLNNTTTSGDNRFTQAAVVANDSQFYSIAIFLKKDSSQYCRVDMRFTGGTGLTYAYVVDLNANTAAQVGGANAATATYIFPLSNSWICFVIYAPNNSTGNTACDLSIYPGIGGGGLTPVVGATFAA